MNPWVKPLTLHFPMDFPIIFPCSYIITTKYYKISPYDHPHIYICRFPIQVWGVPRLQCPWTATASAKDLMLGSCWQCWVGCGPELFKKVHCLLWVYPLVYSFTSITVWWEHHMFFWTVTINMAIFNSYVTNDQRVVALKRVLYQSFALPPAQCPLMWGVGT